MFCIQRANIPKNTIGDILNVIKENNIISNKISQLEQTIEEKENSMGKESNDKKRESSKCSNEINELNIKIQELENCIKSVSLPDVYIPNSLQHLSKWDSHENTSAFTSNISNEIILKLMLLNDVSNNYKLLLMMGIGVFTKHESVGYREIIKELAEDEKLYLIIASSDYIYGTNYQFCHGYIGKNMINMTQEKTIQAIGRIGRNKIKQDYSVRFRDDSLIKQLFVPDQNRVEVINMNKLFNSD